ncbi:MAG: efflux RND transporter permease subunit, partial [Pseudomonadota bacterium]
MWKLRAIDTLVRFRLLVLVLVGLISIGASIFATRVAFDNSIDIWFLEDDPDLVTYKKFLDRFGADEIAVAVVLNENVFSPKLLRAIDRITRSAENAPFAHRVHSLTNVRVYHSEKSGENNEGEEIRIAKLVEKLPKTSNEAKQIRNIALANTLLSGNLVAPDGKAAAILIELSPKGNSFEGKTALLNALRKIQKREKNNGINILLGGTPALDDAFSRYSPRDVLRFGPISIALVIFISFVVFRRITSALIPVSVVILSSLWILGLMGLLGIKFNVVSSALLAFIAAVGIADSVHVLADYYRHLTMGETPQKAVRNTVSGLLTPCFFTSATTAAGLLSLTVSDLSPIRQFGWLAAIAVGIAFVLSVTFVPVILQYARPSEKSIVLDQHNGLMHRLLKFIGQPLPTTRKITIAVSFLLSVGAIASIPNLKIGLNAMNYFHENAPIRKNSMAIDRAIGGSTSLEFAINAKDEGLKQPHLLHRIDKLQHWLEQQPGVVRALSIVDSLKELNRVLQHNNKKELP